MAEKEKGDREISEKILWRLLVFFISGIVLYVWTYATLIILIVNWFIVLFSGKKNNDLGIFVNYYALEITRFVKYTSFQTNEKPFPFTELKKKK